MFDLKVNSNEVEGQPHSFRINGNPDECPICHRAINPVRIDRHSMRKTEDGVYEYELLYRCPDNRCRRLFIASYLHVRDDCFALAVTYPQRYVKPTIPAEVAEVSPAFEKIFGQALEAESFGLDEIAGVGFRRSLEFLVKDYLIANAAGDESRIETIKAKFLGPCINEFVTDQALKDCAARAAWIGNDETHYVRKWEGKDIKDLKTLIELTAGWIRQAELTKKYQMSMAKGR